MNRRSFLAGIPFLPTAVKAVVTMPAVDLAVAPGYYPGAYRADSRGIHQLLKDCGKCVEPAAVDLDAIFQRIYRVERHRDMSAPELWVRMDENYIRI